MKDLILKQFKEAGFGNIKSEPIEDLIFGWLTEDGEIEAINKQLLIHSVARKLHILDPVDITYEQAVQVREIFNW